MLIQAVFSLLCPPALLTLVASRLCVLCGVGEWIYVPLILVGIFSGLYSMIRYLLAASAHIRVLEEQDEKKKASQKRKEPPA